MTRTILRLHAKSIEVSTNVDDDGVSIRTDDGTHRFRALPDDRALLRAHQLAASIVEITVHAEVSSAGEIVGGELLEVVGTVDEPREPVTESGVVLRRTILADDADDVDIAFERIRGA